jgi:DUF1680 family protein
MASKFTPAPLGAVTITDGFWKRAQDTNRQITLPIQHKLCRERIQSLKDVIDGRKREPSPHFFWPSDLAKWLEAAAYSLTTHPDASLKRKLDRVVDLLDGAQMSDGYVNPYFQDGRLDERWTNLRDMHELYCAGHLMEAAVAYHQATGDGKFLAVMTRFADHIDRQFGRRPGQMRGYPGHEEIELALVKMHQATGETRYLDLAKFFIDERGQSPNYFEKEAKARGEKRRPDQSYWQAHEPVRDQTEAVGHAVRACYLYAAMADVAAATDDRKLLSACKRLWRNIVERRMYIIGGVGSQHGGETFTFDYDLPNEQAYAETCAAIAMVFFAQRMLNATGDGQYADVMERCLYNGTISGVSLTGDRFFYDNYLTVHPPYHHFAGRKSPERQEWFGCACCPPNIARLLASLGSYVYSVNRSELRVNLFATGSFKGMIAGKNVTLDQKTDYPWQETVSFRLGIDTPTTFALAIRIPQWCEAATLSLNGQAVNLAEVTRKGYARIRRKWKAGDRLQLTLPMPIQRIEAHPHVRHDAGRVALQRGPVVYCLEQIDNGPDLNAIALPDTSRLTAKHDPSLLGGVTVIRGKAKRLDARDWKSTLYRAAGRTQSQTVTIKAVPYYAWANRKQGEMIVWVRRD